MTKQVRIENADTASFKVRVRVQHLNSETGEWVDQPAEAKELPHPTAMAETYLTSHRRLVVEEY